MLDTTESRKGEYASETVPVQPQKSVGFLQLPAHPQGASSGGISCIPQVCTAPLGSQTQSKLNEDLPTF